MPKRVAGFYLDVIASFLREAISSLIGGLLKQGTLFNGNLPHRTPALAGGARGEHSSQ
jgi:hypothetical protein